MKILIVGCGSIGKRHLKNLKYISSRHNKIELMLYRSSKTKENVSGAKTYFDFGKALNQKPDAVFITNPTSLHVQTAIKAAKMGCHLFIEKPLSHNMSGVGELMDIVKEKNICVMVGYNMRFHPSLKLIKKLLDKGSIGKIISARIDVGSYLPDWRPEKDYRNLYSAKKHLGGGVILDLSHELDYLRWLLGEVTGVFCLSGKLSNLEIDTEDTAEILLRLDTGAIVEVHLDYIQRAPSRSCEIIGEHGTIRWDFFERSVKLFSAKSRKWKIFKENKRFDINQTYIDEIKHFIACIKKKEKPTINEVDGKKALNIVLAAKKSSSTGKLINTI